MEIYIDLLKKTEKSSFRIIVGIIFFLISAIWLIGKIYNNIYITGFDWFYVIAMALNGIVHIIEGFGISIEKKIGSAYVSVNEEKISIKTGIFEKQQTITWNEIQTINYKLNRYEITRKNEELFKLDLSKLNYSVKKEVNNVISKIAKEKNLLIKIA